MVIKDLNSIVDTDVEKLSEAKLHILKSDLIETLNAAEKTSKRKFFSRLDYVVQYIMGFGLMATAFNIIYPYLRYGRIILGAKEIAIGVISIASVLTTSCLKRISAHKYSKIKRICTEKLNEVDRKIISFQFLDELKREHAAMTASKDHDDLFN